MRRKSYHDRTRRFSRRAKAAMALFRARLGHEYTTDAQGRRIRVFTKDNWCGPEEVRGWLLNRRVVEVDEALEHISQAVLRFLIDGGYIRKDGHGGAYYWITAKAARKYDLPRVLGCPFPELRS